MTVNVIIISSQVLSAVVCLFLGLFTLTRNPRQPANIGFAIGMTTLALIEVGYTLILLSYSIGLKLSVIGQALLPLSWLVFTITFARVDGKERLVRRIPVLAVISAISLFFIIMMLNSGFITIGQGIESIFLNGSRRFVVGTIGKYFFIYLLLGLVLNMVNLEKTLVSSEGSSRWRIKYVIFGVGSILAFFIYLSSQAILFSSISFETIPLTSAVIIIATVMMSIFIVRHRLLDVDVFVSRHVVYNSVTVLIVGIYLLAVGILTQGIKYFNVPFNYFFTTLFVFTSILALVVVLFTTRLRRKTKLFINRHFYKHKYEFRDKWMETIKKISSKTSEEDVKNTLKEMVLESMGASPVFLWFHDSKKRSFISEDEDVPVGLRRLPEDIPFVDYLRDNPIPGFLNNMDVTIDEGEETSGSITGLSNCVLFSPLVAGGEIIGFTIIGPDMSGDPYMEDDLEFLKAVTTQAAVQIKNIRLAEEILEAREVEAFSKMSSFIMHDLKNLTNSLSLISQNARHNMDNPEFQKDAIKTIDGTVKRMTGVIEKLSALPKKIHLMKKETDIQEMIERIIRNTVPPKEKKIGLSYETGPGQIPSVLVDPEAIEMVVLNIILNAFDAIEKEGFVHISAYLNGKYLKIGVKDDGSGMSEEFMRESLFRPFNTTKAKGIGIGLFQCKSIVEAHGGEIAVESLVGCGTTFTVKLPAY